MRVCVACGREKVVIGYETAEQLNVEPAKYFVRITKREKRACPHCPEQGVACAPLLPRIIQKSLASDQLIIETIVTGRCSFNRPRVLAVCLGALYSLRKNRGKLAAAIRKIHRPKRKNFIRPPVPWWSPRTPLGCSDRKPS